VSELSTAPQQTPAGAAEEARGVLLGQLAPQFSLAKLGTEDTVASDDLLGTPTVLSFWTTWCPYCLRQTPIMVAAAARYAAADVQFVGIDVGEKPDVVVPYVAEHAISYPILLDAASDAAATFGISGYPTTYFLDADGRIVAHHIGAMTEQQLTEYIEELLATG
jgi:thiol-disulfide isomerase/thioredoxin